MSETASENVVTLTMTAGWFAVLMQELVFASNVVGRADMHHSDANCASLYRMLMEQAGTKVAAPEPSLPSSAKEKKKTCFDWLNVFK